MPTLAWILYLCSNMILVLCFLALRSGASPQSIFDLASLAFFLAIPSIHFLSAIGNDGLRLVVELNANFCFMGMIGARQSFLWLYSPLRK